MNRPDRRSSAIEHSATGTFLWSARRKPGPSAQMEWPKPTCGRYLERRTFSDGKREGRPDAARGDSGHRKAGGLTKNDHALFARPPPGPQLYTSVGSSTENALKTCLCDRSVTNSMVHQAKLFCQVRL